MKLRGRRLLSTAAYTAWAARRTLSGRRLPATATWATCGVLRARAWGSRLGCVRRCCGAVAWDLVGAVPGVKKNFGGAIIVGTRGEYSVAAPGDVRDAIGGDNSGGTHVRARRRTMIFPARKKGETAARSQMGRTGGARVVGPVGRRGAHRRYCRRQDVRGAFRGCPSCLTGGRSGKIFDGALTILLQCFYMFSSFFSPWWWR